MRSLLSSRWLWIGLALGGGLFWLLVDPADRVERVARWGNTLVAPEFAFIGDSLTRGGGLWGWRLRHNPLAAINLARNGATTSDIVEQARQAATYRPRQIVVMAGTNDAMHPVDPVVLRATWRELLGFIGTIPVIVFLPARTTAPVLNDKLREMDTIIRDVAAEAGACLVDINDTLAPDGVLHPDYTTDGVHFTQKTYDVWAARIAEAARTCPRRIMSAPARTGATSGSGGEWWARQGSNL